MTRALRLFPSTLVVFFACFLITAAPAGAQDNISSVGPEEELAFDRDQRVEDFVTNYSPKSLVDVSSAIFFFDNSDGHSDPYGLVRVEGTVGPIGFWTQADHHGSADLGVSRTWGGLTGYLGVACTNSFDGFKSVKAQAFWAKKVAGWNTGTFVGWQVGPNRTPDWFYDVNATRPAFVGFFGPGLALGFGAYGEVYARVKPELYVGPVARINGALPWGLYLQEKVGFRLTHAGDPIYLQFIVGRSF